MSITYTFKKHFKHNYIEGNITKRSFETTKKNRDLDRAKKTAGVALPDGSNEVNIESETIRL